MFELMMTDETKKRIKDFKKDMYKTYKAISNEDTPAVDGTGKKIIEKRPDGYDFIVESYMREALDKHFPGWSWEMGAEPKFLGSEWVIVWGTLTIIDEHLIAFNINPPVRKFSAANGVRIKYGRNKEHTPEGIVDIGNDVASANSKALKKAINQLTHIGDDVYCKRIEEEGAGTLEDVISFSTNPDLARKALSEFMSSNSITYGKVCELMGVAKFSEIEDCKLALEKLKELIKGGGV